jgi:predicted enzyme related to lactoylglutathione lyase
VPQASPIDAYCKKVEKVGGVVILPKTQIGPNMSWIAASKDTEGNMKRS